MEEESNGSKFGVKSYLHYFYEDCSGIGLCEVEQNAHHNLSIKRRNYKWATCIALSIIGFFMASAGLVLLVFGVLNSPLDANAFVGAALLCVGGVTLAVCLTLINIEIIKRKQEILEQEHFQKRCKEGLSVFRENYERKQSESDSPPSTPSSLHSPGDLPVSLYQVSAVQPLLENPTAADAHYTATHSPRSSLSSDQ